MGRPSAKPQGAAASCNCATNCSSLIRATCFGRSKAFKTAATDSEHLPRRHLFSASKDVAKASMASLTWPRRSTIVETLSGAYVVAYLTAGVVDGAEQNGCCTARAAFK